MALLRSLDPDLLVLGSTGIIREHVLDIPRIGTLGCHYALLPDFEGVNVTEWSIYYDRPVEISIFWVDPDVDTGDILLQRDIPVMPRDTLASVRRRSADEGKKLLVERIRMIMEGQARRIPQQPGFGEQHSTMHPRPVRLVERKLAEGKYAYMKAKVT